jgi:hypothetical protein
VYGLPGDEFDIIDEFIDQHAKEESSMDIDVVDQQSDAIYIILGIDVAPEHETNGQLQAECDCEEHMRDLPKCIVEELALMSNGIITSSRLSGRIRFR